MEYNYLWLMIAGVIVLFLAPLVIWLLKRLMGKIVIEKWENEKIRSKYFINKKGVREGVQTCYFRNGKVNKKAKWVKNQLHGKSVVFYATGEKYINANYNEGKLHGDFNVYSKDGKIIWSGSYLENILVNQNKNEVTDTEKAGFYVENLSDTDLFSISVKKDFIEEQAKYNAVKQAQETRDIKKSKSGFFTGVMKIGRVVSGVEAYRDRNSSISLKEASEELYNVAFKITEVARKRLNNTISEFGSFRLVSLQETTGRFLGMLKDMKQNNSIKEYEILGGIGIDNKAIQKMQGIDMAASKALSSSATVGALGAAAAMGTPALVTGTVSALATASTGTAISSLSGVAATNATMAWLGGGSLATGGGGMAAGATALSTITAGATAGVGLIAAGLIASTYYSKKLTESKEFQRDVECRVADMEKLWVLMDGINKRTFELRYVTGQLTARIVDQLVFLEPLVVDYDASIAYYNTVFQKVGVLAKSMSDLVQTPLLDDAGSASNESAQVIQQTYKVLNEKLINHG